MLTHCVNHYIALCTFFLTAVPWCKKKKKKSQTQGVQTILSECRLFSRRWTIDDGEKDTTVLYTRVFLIKSFDDRTRKVFYKHKHHAPGDRKGADSVWNLKWASWSSGKLLIYRSGRWACVYVKIMCVCSSVRLLWVESLALWSERSKQTSVLREGLQQPRCESFGSIWDCFWLLK